MFFTSVTAADKPQLNPALFKTLSAAFDAEPHLLPATAQELAQSFWDGLALLTLTETGDVAFYCRLIPLVGTWYELGSTLTLVKYRERRLNEQAYATFLALHEEKDILATTTNEASLRVGKKFGFVTVPRTQLPEQVWRATCSCPSKKTGTQTHDRCTLAWAEIQHQAHRGTCWLRITAPTAARLSMQAAA